MAKTNNNDMRKMGLDDKLTSGGDVIFNFDKDKYDNFKKMIEEEKTFSEEDKVRNICKLVWCHCQKYSLENFSLMLTTGGMNSKKGLKGNDDRVDKHIFCKKKYYEACPQA